MHRKKKKFDVKEAMRQLLNKYKKQLQEAMHKVCVFELMHPGCGKSRALMRSFYARTWCCILITISVVFFHSTTMLSRYIIQLITIHYLVVPSAEQRPATPCSFHKSSTRAWKPCNEVLKPSHNHTAAPVLSSRLQMTENWHPQLTWMASGL